LGFRIVWVGLGIPILRSALVGWVDEGWLRETLRGFTNLWFFTIGFSSFGKKKLAFLVEDFDF
jgi:hypothetical protein